MTVSASPQLEDSTPLSTSALVRRFWGHLRTRRKRQLGVLLVLMLLASVAEIVSLGAVIPFLGILVSPERVFSMPITRELVGRFGITSASELLLPMTVLFVSAALIAGAVRLLLLYVTTRLSYAIGADLSYEIYRRTLYQPYAIHISRNSSEIISGVTSKVTTIISGLMMPVLTLISSIWLLLGILLALIAVDPVISLEAFAGFGVIYGVIVLFTRRRLTTMSARIAIENTRVIQVLQEGLGGIRDVLIGGFQDAYCRQYRQADLSLRSAQAYSTVLGAGPRFAAEALGISFIALLAFFMMRERADGTEVIALLGILALGAQRLLPVLQQGYLSIVQLRSSRHSLHDALLLLDQPIDQQIHGPGRVARLTFERALELRHVGFHYADRARAVLSDISLTVRQGERVGLIGETGSGKSTLLDVIMGLLPPTQGALFVDGVELTPARIRAWQALIAHVPQAIHLVDGSIAENIAFGSERDQIDLSRVREAARQARIADYIDTLPAGYDTSVGERGVRLSGGQRQRIGIARALYREARIIFFDEATSALDTETERAVMECINSLSGEITVFLIAHRLSTLRYCDRIFRLEQGALTGSGTFEQMVPAS